MSAWKQQPGGIPQSPAQYDSGPLLCHSDLSGLPDKRHCTVEHGQELRCGVLWQRMAPQGLLCTAENFQTPADVPSQELLGLEYLFSQSTGESGPFPLQDNPVLRRRWFSRDTPILVRLTRCTTAMWRQDDILDVAQSHIMLTSQDTSTVHPSAFKDACRPKPLPGFEKLETFCSLLVEIGLAEDKLLGRCSPNENNQDGAGFYQSLRGSSTCMLRNGRGLSQRPR
ncbi:uncharacterized protein LOC131357466 isoform X2 [Hemibagrus wyckioides]|uniref:uncharacterized protein LOC131357466 isoform X2 n=1 Tax=Hemibagrus wyckioides TaxID=337641 RepID=UPI00266B3F95|nr:uncharacterized protein LOC131357466 isoform X2 [Hemibagrus wyckioides]